VSTFRLETFSDSVFAIAVTLLALQLHPPNLGGASTAGAVLDALGQELRPFGFYTLAFLVTGRLWIEHHQLLDPLETHGRRLPRVNLWFLLAHTDTHAVLATDLHAYPTGLDFVLTARPHPCQPDQRHRDPVRDHHHDEIGGHRTGDVHLTSPEAMV
jgi:hypothetical protein